MEGQPPIFLLRSIRLIYFNQPSSSISPLRPLNDPDFPPFAPSPPASSPHSLIYSFSLRGLRDLSGRCCEFFQSSLCALSVFCGLYKSVTIRDSFSFWSFDHSDFEFVSDFVLSISNFFFSLFSVALCGKISLDTQLQIVYNIHLTNRGFLIWRTKVQLKRPSRRGRDSATLHFAF
jgi:hypothetical protein